MAEFEPVFLAPERLPTRGFTQTFLRHTNLCPRSGFLYLHHDGPQTAEMVRGTAVHEILARATQEVIRQDEPQVPPDIVKVIADEVLGEYPVRLEDHDYVREAVYRWAEETVFDPSRVVAVEGLFAMEMGVQVRCRVDYAELTDAGVRILDYKTGRGVPAWDDFSRTRADGTLAAKDFQLVLYALALKYGKPVIRVGDEEHLEPFPVAEHAQSFELEYVYPGVEDREGRMVRRVMTLTHLELVAYLASLQGLVIRTIGRLETGDWPAIVSDAACSICPAAPECPIPPELRDHRGEIATYEDAVVEAMVLDREKADHRARQTALRSYVKANGPLLVGGKVFELVYSESDVVTDREGLLEAADRAARFGEPLERWRFVSRRGRTEFKSRDAGPEEEFEGER